MLAPAAGAAGAVRRGGGGGPDMLTRADGGRVEVARNASCGGGEIPAAKLSRIVLGGPQLTLFSSRFIYFWSMYRYRFPREVLLCVVGIECGIEGCGQLLCVWPDVSLLPANTTLHCRGCHQRCPRGDRKPQTQATPAHPPTPTPHHIHHTSSRHPLGVCTRVRACVRACVRECQSQPLPWTRATSPCAPTAPSATARTRCTLTPSTTPTCPATAPPRGDHHPKWQHGRQHGRQHRHRHQHQRGHTG